MVFTYITHAIVYVILIALVHYLYMFFRNNLTTPKVIDLVNRPAQEYNKIYNTINNNKSSVDMKSELKEYFKNLKNGNQSTKTPNMNSVTSIQELPTTQNSVPMTLDPNSGNYSSF